MAPSVAAALAAFVSSMTITTRPSAAAAGVGHVHAGQVAQALLDGGHRVGVAADNHAENAHEKLLHAVRSARQRTVPGVLRSI
jgi:hypothetical protein